MNYGLLMVADAMFGTHWQPGDPAPKVWSEAIKIWEEFGEVSQQAGRQTDRRGRWKAGAVAAIRMRR